MIWRGRWLIAIATLAGLVAGLIYQQRARPIYVSTSRVYVEQKGAKVISSLEGVMTQSKNYLFTQCELLRSTPILAGAMEKPAIRQLKMLRGIDNPVAFLRNVTQVSLGAKDDIINVSCRSPYPEDAARVVNAVIDSYLTYNLKRKRSTAAEVLRVLQTEKAKRENDLAEKLQALVVFKKQRGVLSFGEANSNIIASRLARLSSALTQAELEVIEARADHKIIQMPINDESGTADYTMIPAISGIAGEGRLTAEFSGAQRELIKLKQNFTDEHPVVRETRKKLELLSAQLRSQGLAATRRKLETALQKKAEIQALFERQQELAEELNVTAAAHAILQSHIRRAEKLCGILDDRIKEINVTEDAGVLNISVLEVARPATHATSPRKARAMAVALMLGLTAGVALALARDKLDHRLRSSEEITAVTGAPVLGVVPHMHAKHTHSQRATRITPGKGALGSSPAQEC